MNGFSLSRLIRGSVFFNVLNMTTVEVFFQKSPDNPSGDTRGIEGLTYEVFWGTARVERGTTGNNGKIIVPIFAGRANVRLVHGGGFVEYELTVSSDALDAANTRTGQKQRLRLLGYQLGHAGPDGDGVDGNDNFEFERSVLDFQVEIGTRPDANIDAAVQNQLTSANHAGG